MAAGLLAQAAFKHQARGLLSASAGFLESDKPVHPYVVKVLAKRDIDVSAKKSQQISAEIVERADLVLTMTCQHSRAVIGNFPTSLPKVFTVRDFCGSVTARPQGVSVSDWLASINQLSNRSYAQDQPHLDIDDPIGKDFEVYTELETELDQAIDWIVGCAFPKRKARN